MTALGLIETYGLLAAVEGADAMLKAADVRLLGRYLVGGGLVTITVAGEVAAVQAAVEAGAASIGRIAGARLVSRHVIARPDAEVATVITLLPLVDAATVSCPVVTEAQTCAPATPAATATVPAAQHTAAQLKKMSVGQLRHLADNLEVPDVEALSMAGKKALIDAVLDVYRNRQE